MIQKLIEAFPDDMFMRVDGFDEAIIGVDELSMRVIYSVSKCIEILMQRDGMTQDEADEYFYYNVHSAYVGDKTPIWCTDFMLG